MSFIDVPLTTDSIAMEDRAHALMAEAFPGWTPAAGNLETWLIKAFAQGTVDLAELAADVPAEIFYAFGEKILGLPPVLAARAQALTTWTMVDAAGYTIPAGTKVGFAVTGSETVAFQVVTEVQVPAGLTSTDDAQVVLEAVIPGEQGNGLTPLNSEIGLIDALPFVANEGIELEAVTSGGEDAEAATVYLDRLTDELKLLAPRPITVSDVETMARRVPGVHRALALDGYDEVSESFDAERTVTVVIADPEGEAPSGSTIDALSALLEARREANFVFYVRTPDYRIVDVSATVTVYPGFSAAAVEGSVEQALADYLSPANWGRSPFDEDYIMRQESRVRYLELVTVVNNVTGVDYVTDLKLAFSGAPLESNDLIFYGFGSVPTPTTSTIVRLTRPGNITVSAS